jgi:DNA-binding NarL/FixJ family response regulator
MSKCQLMLVDDHVLVRAGIKALVEDVEGFAVCAEAGNISEAMRLAHTTTPDMVITDLSMGDDNGLDLVRALRLLRPDLPVIVLSMHASESLIAKAFELGACAYVTKDAAPMDLALALGSARRGDTYLSAPLTIKMMQWTTRSAPAASNSLTQRQSQILGMIGACMNTKQIAFALQLSEKTVAAHRAQIMDRVGIRDRVGLAMLARERGLATHL